MDAHASDRESIERDGLPDYFDRCRERGWTALNEKAGKALLAAFGLAVPRSRAVADPDAAALACAALSPPYAVKVLSSRALHKSDLGGVRLGLRSAAEVRAAACGIRDGWPADPHWIEGFLVEEMAAAGHELVIGGYVDPQFGPMLMVGLGGVFVEIFSDVAFRVCPIDRHQAQAMLEDLCAFPVLRGARGGVAASQDAIIDALLKVGGRRGLLMELADDIDALDINPLIVDGKAAVAVDARVSFAPARRPARLRPAAEPIDFGPLFAPRTIAVAGVSASGQGAGNRFIRNLEILGFSGDIYPMHPSLSEIGGRPAYRTFADMPRQIDYAYIAVPGSAVPQLLAAAGGKVRFAQIMTSGFGEGGRGTGGRQDLVAAIKAGGMRVLGPNSLGVYAPRGRLGFTEIPPIENPAGHIGVILQSGGFGIDMLRYGQLRGLRFRAVATIGNSIDLGPNDLLAYFLADGATRAIGLYLEDIQDGRRFFELLSEAGAGKPVVLLKGGRSRAGQKAAASHTGSLAGDARVWQAVAAQTGCVLVDTVEELVDALLLFQTATPNFVRPTRSLALLGNGGGASVVATDGFARLGFSLAEFSPHTKERLAALNLPDGASGANPIDVPANVFDRTEGRVANALLDALCGDSGIDAVVVHLNLPVLLSYRGRHTMDHIIDACLSHRQAVDNGTLLIMVLRSDGGPEADTARRAQMERAAAAGIPVFENFDMAGRALKALAAFEDFHFKKSRQEHDSTQLYRT